MASVICVHFRQHVDPCVNHIGIHLITLLNLFLPIYQQAHSNAKCHEVRLTVKLLNINGTLHMHQNRVRDTITHVTLNTINGVV
jgi:hypothetical protein